MFKNKPLYEVVTFIVFTTITLIMSSLLVYEYFTTKNELIKELKTDANTSLYRLEKSLIPFINSYSISEYEKLIENEFQYKTILSISLKDYVTGELINEEFVTSKVRDKNWKVTDLKNPKAIKEKSFFSIEKVLYDGNKKIALITISYTDKFLKNKLNTIIHKNILITLIVSLLLIVVLFISLKRLVINPLNNIISQTSNRDESALPKNKIIVEGSKETMELSSTLNNMIERVRESKELIKKLNNRFELTLDAVQDGIWDWNVQSDKAFFSLKWKSMLGYEDNDIKNKGKAFFELIHEEDKKKVESAIKKHFENPIVNPYNLEIRLRCKDNTYKWVLTRGKVQLDENNIPLRMLGFHTDITKAKRNEEYLKQQDKMIAEQSKLASMGEMIGNIAHQWRQPLSIISTIATSYKLKKDFNLNIDTENLIEEMNMINKNAQFLSRTIDDFRNFITNKSVISTFNLNKNMNNFLQLVESTRRNHHIQIIFEENENIFISGYSNELIQCYLNIFNNAKDALDNNDESQRLVIISIIKKKEKVFISFKDNAGGISEDIIEKIFEPYFTTKHQSKGTGIGLTMTYNLISKIMNGKITVNNVEFKIDRKKYKGAEFTIELPLNNKEDSKKQ